MNLDYSLKRVIYAYDIIVYIVSDLLEFFFDLRLLQFDFN